MHPGTNASYEPPTPLSALAETAEALTHLLATLPTRFTDADTLVQARRAANAALVDARIVLRRELGEFAS